MCRVQTALCMYCFHNANENVTTIVPLFSKPENNIGNLKNKIKDKKGFPVETQRIFYDGEVLNDD